MMTIIEKIKHLQGIADLDSCDGTCDSKPPYTKCPECAASEKLNAIGEILS